ncbi:A24 family peptidase [Tessaracoccus lapidicaptus]|uniref:A24 family peptidase n=1 Tax=Tessaracoccus lapidicaptus TaxID=1427523 RepID=UPI003340005E
MTIPVAILAVVVAVVSPLLSGSFVGRSRWVVAIAATTLLVVWVWWRIGYRDSLEPLGFLALAAFWGAATAVDVAEHRLPDPLTLIPYPLFFALQVPYAWLSDEWGRIGAAFLGSLLTSTVLFVLAYINPSGFGLGDVKLGLTTGAALGWFGVGTALLGVGAAFILMALISALLLVTKRIRRDSEIPFGPFMILGVLVAPFAASLLSW